MARTAWLLVGSVVLTAGCGLATQADDPGPPTATSTTSARVDPSPAPCPDGGAVVTLGSSTSPTTLKVGDCLFVAGYDTLEKDLLGVVVTPAAALTKVDRRTYRAALPGTATVTVKSYFHDCRTGPCARPNEPVPYPVTVSR